MRVLICGGGIVGASIAYHLGRRGVASTVFERTGLACAASGKGGGFLAAGWCDGTPVGPLPRRSFALHAALAEELEGDWGYRRLDTYGGTIANGRRSRPDGPRLGWLSNAVALNGQLGSTTDTAQVHPRQLAAALMRAAEATGSELRLGEVTGILRSRMGERAIGVEVDGEAWAGDAVVVAMGPWSRLARRWLPMPAVYALKGHSLVFGTGAELPPEALFLEHRDENGDVSSPESSRGRTAPPISPPSTARLRFRWIRPTLHPIPALWTGCTRLPLRCRRFWHEARCWRGKLATDRSHAMACP